MKTLKHAIEVNEEEASDRYLLSDHWTTDYIKEQLHTYALGVLVELGQQLMRYFDNYFEHYYGDKTEQNEDEEM